MQIFEEGTNVRQSIGNGFYFISDGVFLS